MPQIQVYARAYGNLEWMCPACSSMHETRRAPWRTAHVQCHRMACRRKFRTGIGFVSDPYTDPTYAYCRGGNGKTVNSLEMAPHAPVDFRARWIGRIDWSCPKCATQQSSSPDWDTGRVVCDGCNVGWGVRVILYPAKQHLPITPPLDWIAAPYAKETSNRPIPSTEARPCQ